MKLGLNTATKKFIVGRSPEPKLDMNGVQKRDRKTGVGLIATQLIVFDEDGGDTLVVVTPGKPPQLTQGQGVVVENLIAFPWVQGDRHGVAYRADSIRPEGPQSGSSGKAAS